MEAIRILSALLAVACSLVASEYRGRVLFNGLPVPGVMVIATEGDQKFTAITDETGGVFIL